MKIVLFLTSFFNKKMTPQFLTRASINFNFWMWVFSLYLGIIKKNCDHVGGEEGKGRVILLLLLTGVGPKQISVYANLKFRQTSKGNVQSFGNIISKFI